MRKLDGSESDDADGCSVQPCQEGVGGRGKIGLDLSDPEREAVGGESARETGTSQSCFDAIC